MKRIFTIVVIIILILVAALAAYVYYMLYVPPTKPHITDTTNGTSNGFSPLNPGLFTNNGGDDAGFSTTTASQNGTVINSGTQTTNQARIPTLRVLSTSPVGGYGIGRTGTTTVVRWVDRGRGNIYEATNRTTIISTLSNTLVPRIYHSVWNNSLTAFVGQYMSDSSDKVTTILANLVKTTPPKNATTTVSETPFQLKGKLVSGKVIASAFSPSKDRILLVSQQGERSVGYISKFDGSSQVQIFDVPMNQITVDWPEENTLTISTKASALYPGFLYRVNAKTGEMKALLSNIPGLKAKMSHDATKIFYSYSGNANERIKNAVYDIKSGQTTEVIFKTLADKCAWSSKNKAAIFCGVPSQLYDGTYPDDWYLGGMTFTDKIWKLETSTNKAQLIASPLTAVNVLIDTENLELDPNDEYLYFMNKLDLSLWSLDLVSTN